MRHLHGVSLAWNAKDRPVSVDDVKGRLFGGACRTIVKTEGFDRRSAGVQPGSLRFGAFQPPHETA
jgi:hypothetical protein